MTSTPVFEVRNVSFAYDNSQAALEHVDLTVRSGESLVILGANGSGKSTLLKLLDGLYFPTEGEIAAFGEPLTESNLRDDAFNFAFRRRVGLVFQDSDVQLFCPSVMDEGVAQASPPAFRLECIAPMRFYTANQRVEGNAFHLLTQQARTPALPRNKKTAREGRPQLAFFSAAGVLPATCWRRAARQLSRCLRIQSSRARSKPMS